MAQTLDAFPTTGTAPRYPWDEWLNGQVWELRPGQDYNGKTQTLRQMARDQAQRRGGKLRTRLLSDEQGERVVLQFQRMA